MTAAAKGAFREHDLLDVDTVTRSIGRIASEAKSLFVGGGAAIVGIRRGGVPLAESIAKKLAGEFGHAIDVGTLDIALYRDDAATALPDPKIGPSEISFPVSGRDIVLVDDVLQTGRTIRAAIDALLDYGRPRRIWLAVLVDRGGRELPIAADFVGRVVDVPREVKLDARFEGDFCRVVARVPEGT